MSYIDSNKYLSLKTVAQLYGYTRDHLGLMIRQGKLKGKKLGNYYVTTNDLMIEYIKNFADPSHPAIRNKLSNKFLTRILRSKEDSTLINISAKNTAVRKPPKTDILKNKLNNAKNAAKENATKENAVNVVNNDLEEKILKELAQYKSSTGIEVQNNKINHSENIISSLSDVPYVILPIRKMENMERKEILNKLPQNNPENNPEKSTIDSI
jgi:hypothetical protein